MEAIRRWLGRAVALAIVSVAIASCTTTSMKQLNGLVGKDIAAATLSLGKAPDASADLGNGARVYTWRWPVAGTGGWGPNSIQQMYEVVSLWTDSSGRIVRFSRHAE